jgi:hypothetical protein
MQPNFRPPLLPLLLAVTGVPAHQTYFWFILTQLVLGVAAVVLMHDCLRVISHSLGLIGAGLFIATFMAFVHSEFVMTEEIYLFGWCMCINGQLPSSTRDYPSGHASIILLSVSACTTAKSERTFDLTC